jgi:hypothetical protein
MARHGVYPSFENCNSRVTLAAIDDARIKTCLGSLFHSSTSYRIGWLDILQCEKLPSFISAPFGSETLFGSVTIYVLSTLMEKWKKKTKQKGFSDLKKTNKQNKRCPTLFSDFFSSRWLAINYIILMDKSNCDELKWRIKKWDLRWSINSPFRRHMFIVVLKLAVDLVKKKHVCSRVLVVFPSYPLGNWQVRIQNKTNVREFFVFWGR